MKSNCVIGIDLGGTKICAGVVGADLTVQYQIKTAAPRDGAEVLQKIAEVVKQLVAQSESEVSAVGCGIPCLIDQRSGKAIMAVNLDIENLNFGEELSKLVGLPVVVDNDANVTALAEHRHGAAQGTSEAVVLTVGTGVGGGLILNGDVYRGAIGAGAELGHISIDLNGPPCQGNCPNRGCLEVLASGTALAVEAQKLVEQNPASELATARSDGKFNGEQITALAQAGQPEAVEAFRRIGHNLGVGITSLVNIFNPEVVVVGGGVSAAGELLLAPARAVVAEQGLRPSRDIAKIKQAHFGPEAGMIGAATLALEAL